MNILISLAFLFSAAALWYAYTAHKLVRKTFHMLESRSTRTVCVDHTDGRITVIKELKDAP